MPQAASLLWGTPHPQELASVAPILQVGRRRHWGSVDCPRSHSPRWRGLKPDCVTLDILQLCRGRRGLQPRGAGPHRVPNDGPQLGEQECLAGIVSACGCREGAPQRASLHSWPLVRCWREGAGVSRSHALNPGKPCARTRPTFLPGRAGRCYLGALNWQLPSWVAMT